MAQADSVTLPRWDLSDLYSGLHDPAIEQDLTSCDNEARGFAERWKGKLATATGQELGEAIADYERIDQRMGRLGAFAQLSFAAHTSDPETGRFSQGMTERLTAISSHLLFLRSSSTALRRAIFPDVLLYRNWPAGRLSCVICVYGGHISCPMRSSRSLLRSPSQVAPLGIASLTRPWRRFRLRLMVKPARWVRHSTSFPAPIVKSVALLRLR